MSGSTMGDELAEIQPGQYTYSAKPVFVSYPKDARAWHVFGPADKIVPGELADVYNHSENGNSTVEIINIVAERMVRKRSGDRVRYVMATFDRIAEEDDA